MRKMEKNIGSFIISVITSLGGWKFIEYLIHRKEMKRKALADAIAVETDSLIKRYNVMENELEKLKDKVDQLYGIIHKLENEKLDLLKHNMELEFALKESRHNECQRPDEECIHRQHQEK